MRIIEGYGFKVYCRDYVCGREADVLTRVQFKIQRLGTINVDQEKLKDIEAKSKAGTLNEEEKEYVTNFMEKTKSLDIIKITDLRSKAIKNVMNTFVQKVELSTPDGTKEWNKDPYDELPLKLRNEIKELINESIAPTVEKKKDPEV